MSLRQDLILLNTVTDIKTTIQRIYNLTKHILFILQQHEENFEIARPKVIEYLKLLKSKGINLQFRF